MFNLNLFKKKEIKDEHFFPIGSSGKLGTFNLLLKYYFKSFYGPFLNFVMPILLLILTSKLIPFYFSLPGNISASIMIIGIFSLPISILELKKSVVLKRLGVSPIKQKDLTFAIICFFTVQIIVTIVWVFVFAYFLYIPTIFWFLKNKSEGQTWIRLFKELYIDELKQMFKLFNNMKENYFWLIFLYGILINSFLSIGIGIAISSWASTPMEANVASILLMFPFLFLSGQFLSPQLLATFPFLESISYFIPYRYVTLLILVGFNGNSLFPISEGGHPFLISYGVNIYYFSRDTLDYLEIINILEKKGVWSSKLGQKLDSDLVKKFKELYDNFKNPKIYYKLIKIIDPKVEKVEISSDEAKLFVDIIIKLNELLKLLTHKNVLRPEFLKNLYNALISGDFSKIGPFHHWFVPQIAFYWWEVLLSHLYPFLITLTLFFYSWKKFKWTSRG